MKRGKLITLQERIDLLLNATTLDQFAFEDISGRIESNVWISPDERANFQRTAIEKFYRVTISADLIKYDDQRNIRSSIIKFEYLTTPSLLEKVTEFLGLAKRSRKQLRIFEDKESSIVLLVILFMSAGIYRNCVFNPDIEYCVDDLARFTKRNKKDSLGYLFKRISPRNRRNIYPSF